MSQTKVRTCRPPDTRQALERSLRRFLADQEPDIPEPPRGGVVVKP